MVTKRTLEKAKRAKREGKSPSTQAGEFIREEIKHVRKGKHGARSAKQIIAIGLSKARRAGVALAPPPKNRVSEKSRKSAKSASEKGKRHEPVSKKRSAAREKAMKKESYYTASRSALSQQTRSAAKKRSPSDRSQSAKKAVLTKGPTRLSEAAKKAVRTKGPVKRSEAAKKAARTRALRK